MLTAIVSILYYLVLLAWSLAYFVFMLLLFALTVAFDRERKALHAASRFWARSIFFLNPLWRLRVEGREHIDPKGAYVVTVNHQSMVDIPLMYVLPKINFKWVAKSGVYKWPLFGVVLWLHGDITVDDKLIDQQVEMFSRRFGKMDDKAESYDAEANDLLQGDLRQLDAEGNTIEGGLTLEAAKLMPSQIKVEAQRDLFKGAKLGDIITFNPRNAYPESDGEMAALLKVEKDQLADYTGDFSFQITQISHFVPAENNEELWKAVYGQDADIKDEAAFRQTIAEGVRQQLVQDEDFKFMQDVRKHCEKKVGELTFANDILKRVMLQNNQDKGEKFVEENYDRSIKELTWHLIKNKLVEQTGVKVEEQDIREIARQSTRAQFAQYGMGNIPDELIEKYADEMLKKRENVEPLVEAAIDRKLAVALKEVVKLDTKEISLEDFNKMLEA